MCPFAPRQATENDGNCIRLTLVSYGTASTGAGAGIARLIATALPDDRDDESESIYRCGRLRKFILRAAGSEFVLPGFNRECGFLRPEGGHLLEPARRAHGLFERQEPREKWRLLNFILSNSTRRNGELVAEFRQPFDMLHVANRGSAGVEANAGGSGG